MARGRSRSRRNNQIGGSPVGRETNRFARRSLPLQRKSILTQIEDRRAYHPEGETRTPKKITGIPSRVVVNRPRSLRDGRGLSFYDRVTAIPAVPVGLSFQDSTRVILCTRRKMRKEVLHAKGVAGTKGLKPPRFNYWSKISCKE